MKRARRVGLTLAAVLAAGAGGYWAGNREIALPSIVPTAWLRALPWHQQSAIPPARVGRTVTGPVIYYRDPDGRPTYSAEPRKTADGREFIAVHASEDISFDDEDQAAADAQPASSPPSAPKKILYYRNPMGLPDISPVPKRDSMGMDYIPVYAGEDDSGSSVKIAPGKLQRTGVRVESASERVIIRQVRVPGTVEPDERRVSVVSVPTAAFVGRVENVTTGDRVRKGQPLLEIRSPAITAAAAQVLIDPGFESTNRRLQNLNVPPEVTAEIIRSHKVPPAFVWSSPRDGIVLMRNATEGMKMDGGAPLFRIADLSTVWVLADVPEYALASVQPGQTATIRIRSLPGRTFQGRVTLIYPEVAKETRTTKVRIEIPNPDDLLRPGMYANVDIAAGGDHPVLVVPDSAVIDTGTRQIVILDKGDGRFEPREVKIGTQGGGFTEIRNGIASGDRVVVAANFLIDADSNLKSALNAMSPAGSPP